MDLVVSRMNNKFSKELGSTQFIQEVINDKNGKFFFNGEFVEGAEVKKHVPITLFLKDMTTGEEYGFVLGRITHVLSSS
jgi:hypothetical protein